MSCSRKYIVDCTTNVTDKLSSVAWLIILKCGQLDHHSDNDSAEKQRKKFFTKKKKNQMHTFHFYRRMPTIYSKYRSISNEFHGLYERCPNTDKPISLQKNYTPFRKYIIREDASTMQDDNRKHNSLYTTTKSSTGVSFIFICLPSTHTHTKLIFS